MIFRGGHRAAKNATIALCLGAAIASCGRIRHTNSEALEARLPDYLEEYAREIQAIDDGTRLRLLASAVETEGGTDCYDVLSLSGGGAFGAFGIGFLTGWAEVTDSELRRPTFDSVSGISTGALIAPYAFVGTDEAYAQVADMYRNPGSDWVRPRGLLGYLPFGLSLFNVNRLHDSIREAVTGELVAELAKGSMEGRQLLIGATNIDFGLMRVWDLARYAKESTPEAAKEHIEQVLIASAAIPGVFPPVEIDGLLHVDGGATLQMLGGFEERDWLFDADLTGSQLALPEGRRVRIRMWIIVNQKLLPKVHAVPPRWISIGARSLKTLMRSSTLQSLQDLETYAHLVSRLPQFDVEFRYVAIPQDFEIPDSDAMFDAEAMQALFAVGQELGRDPSNWRTRTLRPVAPFRSAEIRR